VPENLSYVHSQLTFNLTMHNSGFPYCDFRGICSVRIWTSAVLFLLPQTYTNVFALVVNQLDLKICTANRQNCVICMDLRYFIDEELICVGLPITSKLFPK